MGGDPASDGASGADSGLACLTMLLGFHQFAADADQLRHSLGHGEPTGEDDLVRLAKRMGARARAQTLDVGDLEHTPLPAIGRDKAGGFLIIGAVRDGQVLTQRPGQPPATLSLEEFDAEWSGRAVLVTTRLSAGALAKFDVTWFIPALVKYRWMLGDVLFGAVRLTLKGLRQSRRKSLSGMIFREADLV